MKGLPWIWDENERAWKEQQKENNMAKTTNEVLGYNDENERAFWTNERFNTALDLYVHDTPLRPLANELGTPHWESIERAIEKLSYNYGALPDDKRDSAMDRYTMLRSRRDRTGKRLNAREMKIIGNALSEKGIVRGANTPEWIASLLCRDVEEVQTFLKGLPKPQPKLIP